MEPRSYRFTFLTKADGEWLECADERRFATIELATGALLLAIRGVYPVGCTTVRGTDDEPTVLHDAALEEVGQAEWRFLRHMVAWVEASHVGSRQRGRRNTVDMQRRRVRELAEGMEHVLEPFGRAAGGEIAYCSRCTDRVFIPIDAEGVPGTPYGSAIFLRCTPDPIAKRWSNQARADMRAAGVSE